MLTINDFKFKVEDGQIITDNPQDIISFIEDSSIEGVGFGKDINSLLGTPIVVVFKMSEENYIVYDDGFMCESITVHYNSNDMYLSETFENAVKIETDFNAFGEGYELE